MPSSRRALAVLRALAAGLLAAGLMTIVVAIPSMGAGATAPTGTTRLAALEPDDDPGGDPDAPDEPESPPTVDAEPTDLPTTDPTTPPDDPPTQQPTTEPTTVPGGEETNEPTREPPDNPEPTFTPPDRPGPVMPGQRPQLGALVWTDDITLGKSYWSHRSTSASLRVTVANTGSIVERVTMRYTLPVGVTDAGTRGCALAAGRTYVCGSWVAARGLRWSAAIKVRVAGDAWRKMPLGGSVEITASAVGRPDLGTMGDNQGFAVLFPPGPPVAGISLAASEVAFNSPTDPANLEVKLTNTGDVPSAGAVEVLLPEGVTVGGHPSGCAAAGARTRCDLGRLRGGQTMVTNLPLTATVEAQRLAPLSGAVFGMLTAGGRTKQVQMSFRITAAASTATPSPTPGGSAGPVGPTAGQGLIGGFAPVASEGGGLTGVQKTAIALVVVSILLVVLAITLANTSLRRRIEDDSTAGIDVAAAE